jgi:hypothetical protein
LSAEWRLVVAGDAVVAASAYFVDGVLSPSPVCPAPVREFAERMLADVRWRPDPLFVMDVCECEGRFYLLEFNSFSCSGFYRCDLRAVVSAASSAAREARESAASGTQPEFVG